MVHDVPPHILYVLVGLGERLPLLPHHGSQLPHTVVLHLWGAGGGGDMMAVEVVVMGWWWWYIAVVI